MGLKISMPIATDAIDSSGEIISIEGVDLTAFHDGNAFANWEHNNKDPSDIVGIFLFAKKIYSEKDCDTRDQKKHWDAVQNPFIYGICELFDDVDGNDGHAGAVAVAGMIRYFEKRKLPIKIGASIEGSTLERDGNELKRTVAKKCAITLAPCNKQCWIDLIDDESLSILDKSDVGIGSPLTKSYQYDKITVSDEDLSSDPLQDLRDSLDQLNKTLSAGGYNVAPGQLTGGAALSVEDRTFKNKLKSAVRDWPRTRPLKEWVKAQMPEISDGFLHHFDNISKDYSLKKNSSISLYRINSNDNTNVHQNESQKNLLEGVYLDPRSPIGAVHDYAFGQNDAGESVHIKKRPVNCKNHCDYAVIAHDVFNLNENVPPVASINDPSNKTQELMVQRWHPNLATPLTDRQRFTDSMQRSREDGSIHKLALLDLVLGANRSSSNYGFDNSSKPIFFDSEMSASSITGPHIYGTIGNDTMHVDALKWITSIDPRKLVGTMSKLGRSIDEIKKASFNLKAIQKMSSDGISFKSMHEKLNPQIEEKHND